MNPRNKKYHNLALALSLVILMLAGFFYLETPEARNSPLLSIWPTAPGTTVTAPVTTVTQPNQTQRPTTKLPTTVTVPPTTTIPLPPTTVPTIPTTVPTTPPTTVTTTPPTLHEIPNSGIPKISAKYAFVYDTGTQHFLYTSAATDTAVYPASITKLFTTYVALQYLKMEDLVTVGSELSYVATDASVAGFRKGDVVSVEDLVYGALLPSGCDASYILAAAAGRAYLGLPQASAKNAINAFLSECNRMAANLGMVKTFIANPDGYHNSSHYISLQAMTIISTLYLENEQIAKVCATASKTITYKNAQGSVCTATFQNTNHLIHPGSDYYHELSVGGKTGTTAAAGACLLTAYRVGDRYIVIGVFGAGSNQRRFSDANKLFDACLPYLS